MINYNDRIRINKGLVNYGNNIKVKRKWLIMALFVFCMITPLTNFLLLFSYKIKDINMRW